MVLRAKDIMDTNLLTVDEGTDALTCARRMVAARKGYAVVTRGGPTTVAGIATEWDFLEKVIASHRDPATIAMKEIASADVRGCAPETPTDEVVSTMASLGIRRLIVRSGDQVVGVITSRNILTIFREYIDRLSSEIAAYHSPTSTLG
jgi:CBS domain-containing protein